MSYREQVTCLRAVTSESHLGRSPNVGGGSGKSALGGERPRARGWQRRRDPGSLGGLTPSEAGALPAEGQSGRRARRLRFPRAARPRSSGSCRQAWAAGGGQGRPEWRRGPARALGCGLLASPRPLAQIGHRRRRRTAHGLLSCGGGSPPASGRAGAPRPGLRSAAPRERSAPAPAAGCTAGSARLAAVPASPPPAVLTVRSAQRCHLRSSPRAAPFRPAAWPCALNPVSARNAALLTLGPRPSTHAAPGGSGAPGGRDLGSEAPPPTRAPPLPDPCLCSCPCLRWPGLLRPQVSLPHLSSLVA